MADDVINLTSYLQLTPKAMTDREKRGQMKIQKSEYLQNEKSLLDEIKKDFSQF